MISNQILQNTIEGIKEIAHMNLCVCDAEGKTLANTFEKENQFAPAIHEFVNSQADTQTIKGNRFFKIFDNDRVEMILVVGDDSDSSYVTGKLAVFQVQNLLLAYKERYDKDNFVKNLLLDNLLLVDIYNRAKKLHIDTNVRRCVYIVEVDPSASDVNAIELIHSAHTDKERDFVTAVDEKNTILVKEVKENTKIEELEETAANIISTIHEAGIDDVRISYGTVVKEIKEVSRSYKEAKMALDVGKIFYEEKEVVGYARLGIGRLIYQLPLPLCKMFIKEIFDGKNPDEFDEETVVTINKFFENSLNVSETSRQLYIHRNTLVYRIDKIQKDTGLDLRVFDDAITFKIALMVGKYMKYMENQDY